MDLRNHRPLALLLCSLLAASTLLVFWPVIHNGFIIYDDHQYILENTHVVTALNWPNITWAFANSYASNWHPLTWISHMLDVQMFGLSPAGPHFVNLLLHAANSVLLLLVLRAGSGGLWRSALVAALFALHPFHVESVAWVAERKDVLSAFFFMLTLLAYTAYAKRRNSAEKFHSAERQDGSVSDSTAKTGSAASLNPTSRLHAAGFYALALLSFALGLMSKPMLVTTPFVLLLFDYWPLQRFQLKTDTATVKSALPLLLEKVPFFALTVISSVVTYWAQNAGGSVASLEYLPFESRLENAAVAYTAYLQGMFWPARLAPLYLHPNEWPPAHVVLALMALTVITGWLLSQSRPRPYLLTGWFWFLGMLVPVIGLVQIGNQFMADRYTYLPLIGCFIMVAWGAGELVRKWGRSKAVVSSVALLALLSLAIATNRQTRFWKNSETVLERCLQVDPNNFIAHNTLGAALEEQGRFAEAKNHFQEALHIRPNDPDTLHNFGVALARHGDFEEADSCLAQAVQLKPELVRAYGKIGLILDTQGRTEEAIKFYRQGLLVMPDQPEACNNLAWLLATTPNPELRNGKEAVVLAERACQLTTQKDPLLLGTLAAAYAEAGRFPEAVATARQAITLSNAVGNEPLARRNQKLLELYQAGTPFHDEHTSASSTAAPP